MDVYLKTQCFAWSLCFYQYPDICCCCILFILAVDRSVGDIFREMDAIEQRGRDIENKDDDVHLRSNYKSPRSVPSPRKLLSWESDKCDDCISDNTNWFNSLFSISQCSPGTYWYLHTVLDTLICFSISVWLKHECAVTCSFISVEFWKHFYYLYHPMAGKYWTSLTVISKRIFLLQVKEGIVIRML